MALWNVVLETLATTTRVTSDFLCPLVGDPNPLSSARLPREIQTLPRGNWLPLHMDPEEADFPSIWTLAKGAGVGLGWAVSSISGPLSPPHNGVALLMRAWGGISLERGSPHSLLKGGVSSRHMTQMFPLPPSWFMSFQSVI